MIVQDLSRTKIELARYDARKARINALPPNHPRWCPLTWANIDRVFNTFHAEAWWMSQTDKERIGLRTIREMCE
ncbi:MAG: hypothetical protein ACXW13_00145 [Burkholderiaceae bacterium]